MKAILEIGGKQVLVEPGVKILTELIPEKTIGDQIEIEQVLCVYGDGKTMVGTPHVKGAKVKCTIIGAVRGPKIEIRTYKRRNASKRTKGHRQDYIELKIDDVIAG
jgi:large subunit ribosomal protein L21